MEEIVNGVQRTETFALFIVNDYVLDVIWEIDSIYLFDSRSKDKKNNLSSSVIAFPLTFDILCSLEN